MDREQALAYLSLDGTATKVDIETAWRNAMKAVHPDASGGGDSSRAAMLNEARGIALDGLSDSSSEIVTRRDLQELVQAQAQQVTAVQESEKAVRQVVMHHVGALALQRRQRTSLAIASGGLAAVSALVGALLKGTPEPLMWRSLLLSTAGLFAILGAILGLLSWRQRFLEEELKMNIEDAGETLADKGALAGTLDELGLGSFFSQADLREALSDWNGQLDEAPLRRVSLLFPGRAYSSVPLSFVAQQIGAVDFCRLLLSKGLASGLLQEETRPIEQGKSEYGYRRV